MIRYECDRCGAALRANDPRRFILRMEIFAAADHLDLDMETDEDASRDLEAVLEQLRQADPTEMEDRTYRRFRFDLCDRCRIDLLNHPLGNRPED